MERSRSRPLGNIATALASDLDGFALADRLVPVLHRRGIICPSYTYEEFRDNLLDF
jgi:hypothetical protein